MTHPTPDTPAVPPSEAEALAEVIAGIDGGRLADASQRAHDACLRAADAILASDWLAKVKADARAEAGFNPAHPDFQRFLARAAKRAHDDGAREVTERVDAALDAYEGPWLAMVDDVRAALAPTTKAGR